MLDSAIYYKRAFQHLELLDSNFKTYPSNTEWDRLDIICKFLAPFYEITCAFSGTKYPTSNLFFPCVSTAYASLKHERLHGIEYIRNIATRMLVKFEKYWFDFCDILAIAVILDPRYKFTFVEWCYKKLYGGDYISETKKVRDKLFALFSNYEKVDLQASDDMSSLPSVSSQVDSSTTFPSITKSQFLQDYDSFEEEITMPKKSQLEMYLEEQKIDRKVKLDVIHFWKGNQYRFPEVAAMARDVLCIPISTIASESAFNNSGRILDQYRSALKPDIVEALVCSKDWLYGNNGKCSICLH
ncbi:zinc finger BED domain-containing protein RICESLEEPER 2-like [Dendrobium catenatum]|uniref:zinc finger BED domain-containing protein RICESLEEPER 2-like n=1 Tax=Dendrobium catenatum TaxID=906689 RepID=UPI00109F4506|nr:zinc finger BED domain-containing protein RICESLEEPER 2-like [Dendrobium catenatum]